jgi:hypothetical protein
VGVALAGVGSGLLKAESGLNICRHRRGQAQELLC